MKNLKNIKQILLLVFTLALCAGVFLSGKTANAQSETPWNIVATVTHGKHSVTYNLQNEIAKIKNKTNANAEEMRQISSSRGFYLGTNGKRALAAKLTSLALPDDAVWEYILPGFGALASNFDYTYVQKCDATVSFGKDGFVYTKGADGVCVDKAALFDVLLKSAGRNISVELPLSVEPTVTVADLKKITVKKGEFTTRFVSSGANRRHNIAKAAASLDGLTVAAGQKFSFNEIVGRRTEQNGYKNAKVILEGNYVDGVGGGVCQVSTTLYNALLLSEIIPHACQHSLVSSYVMAGFDAMVSDAGADLTFVNETDHPLYISAKVDQTCAGITFCIYGVPNLYKVVRQNEEVRTPFETVEVVDKQKFPELIYTDQTKVVTAGSDGVRTKSFLCYCDSEGAIVCRRLIRQNTYKKVNRIVARGYAVRPES